MNVYIGAYTVVGPVKVCASRCQIVCNILGVICDCFSKYGKLLFAVVSSLRIWGMPLQIPDNNFDTTRDT